MSSVLSHSSPQYDGKWSSESILESFKGKWPVFNSSSRKYEKKEGKAVICQNGTQDTQEGEITTSELLKI